MTLYPKVLIDGNTYTFTDGGRVLDQKLPQEEKNKITEAWCNETIANAEEIHHTLFSEDGDAETIMAKKLKDEMEENMAKTMLLALATASVPTLEIHRHAMEEANNWIGIWEDAFEKRWKLYKLDELREYGCIYLKYKTHYDGDDVKEERGLFFEAKGRLLGLILSNPRDMCPKDCDSPIEYAAIEFNNIFEWIEHQFNDYLTAKLINECKEAYENEY